MSMKAASLKPNDVIGAKFGHEYSAFRVTHADDNRVRVEMIGLSIVQHWDSGELERREAIHMGTWRPSAWQRFKAWVLGGAPA